MIHNNVNIVSCQNSSMPYDNKAHTLTSTNEYFKPEKISNSILLMRDMKDISELEKLEREFDGFMSSGYSKLSDYIISLENKSEKKTQNKQIQNFPI